VTVISTFMELWGNSVCQRIIWYTIIRWGLFFGGRGTIEEEADCVCDD
jgi:hypothetical protein